MLWIILFAVSILITTITFLLCGAGGFFLLVILNGFSESQAMPFLVLYALISLGVNIVISTAVNWRLVKKRSPDLDIKFWMVAGISSVVPVLLLVLPLLFFVLKNMLF